jgi:hypothetical protein
MKQACKNCGSEFEVTDIDRELLDKVSPIINGTVYTIPSPKFCSLCRMQRRLVFRNQQTLYRRKCDSSGKPIISIYSPDKDQVVYSPDEWWSDTWDAMSYGREVDTDRPFFEQFRELMRSVPHIGVLLSNVQNSEFTNQSYNTRDCYLSSAIKDCDSVIYTQNSNGLTDCTDVSYCFKSELLYECVDTYDSYGCLGAYHCINCSDSMFLFDCVGCRNCFGCSGLRQQEYNFFNQPCNKDEYKQKVQSYELCTSEGVEKARNEFCSFLEKAEHQQTFMLQCENVTGNNIRNSRNCLECYDSLDLEDCRYSTWIFGCKDAMDCYGMGDSQVIYDCVGVEEVNKVAFSFGTSSSNDCYYTDLCFNCSHCFGCVGLRNKKYCIFNTQYSEEEYNQLMPQLIQKMEQEGDWGEFFPPQVSVFAYNETKAHEVFPLTKDQALQQNYIWKDDVDDVPKVDKVVPGDRLPGNIDDIPDDILQWAIHCQETGRPYRITKGELAFYRQRRLPVPRVHPDVRLRKRIDMRNK